MRESEKAPTATAPSEPHPIELPGEGAWWTTRFDEGWSVASLAAHFETNHMKVYRHLRKLGVPTPTQQPFDRWLRARTTTVGTCVRWTGPRSGGRPMGYFDGSTNRSVRRVVWEQSHGPIPKGSWITRIPQCLWSDCVAIPHLRLITPQTHVAERVASAQFRWGENHAHAKLTENDARKILENRSAHPAELAALYNVSKATIYAIRAGRRWRHLHDTHAPGSGVK